MNSYLFFDKFLFLKNNLAHTPTDMEEFLEFLATKIELKGFAGYSGGLDLKSKFFFPIIFIKSNFVF